MAVPKRRHSKSRRDRKRANKGLRKIELVKCPQCKELRKPHHACSNCGYYKGKKVLAIKTKTEEKK